MADQSRLTWALVLSILLHGLLLSLLPWLRHVQLALPKPPALLDVDVMSLPKVMPRAVAPKAAAQPPPAAAIPIPKQQVVSPPDRGEEKAPARTRFLSDQNNTVQKETVHHGQPVAGSPETQHQAEKHARAKQAAHAPRARAVPAPLAAPARPQPQMAGLPKLDQLLPHAGDLVREGLVRPQPAAPQATPQLQAANERTDLLRHGDPLQHSGMGGTMDFLPDVQDSDVTMLNTKADQFAPFVRRVAVRVFENFIILLRRSYGSAAGAAQESATIEAVMDRQGNLLAINTKERSYSGALATDQKLQLACREGFFDRNPPDGAQASDGNIHFIFEARVATAMDVTGRRVPTWALLGAGLL